MNLEQENMSVAKYEQCFVSLISFVDDLHLPNSILAKMFEDKLSPCIKGMVLVQMLRKFRDVVEATMIAEKNQTEIQKNIGPTVSS